MNGNTISVSITCEDRSQRDSQAGAISLKPWEAREPVHKTVDGTRTFGTLSACFSGDDPREEAGDMEVKQPSATFPGFRHIHRGLLPGESIPRRPTLLEQLQALGGSSVTTTPPVDEPVEESSDNLDGEEEEEEWSELS
jgi:hypothetical protein